jgi:predicted nuclease with TOPRIM domain
MGKESETKSFNPLSADEQLDLFNQMSAVFRQGGLRGLQLGKGEVENVYRMRATILQLNESVAWSQRSVAAYEKDKAELQSALAAANEECERLRGDYKALNRQLAVAKKIFDSCRNNDNHWGDVEVENHRLKADLAAKDAMLAAASQSVSDVLASADTNSHSHGHWALVTHENYEKLRAVVAGWLEPTQQSANQ